jgi:hypothetical protein
MNDVVDGISRKLGTAEENIEYIAMETTQNGQKSYKYEKNNENTEATSVILIYV